MLNRPMSRRHLLVGASVCAAAAFLAACAPAPTPQPTTAPAAPKAPTAAPAAKTPIEVTLWSSYSGKNGEAEAVLVERFNTSQDEVKLNYQFQGSYEECAQKLAAALQAKTSPDGCLLSDVWWFKFYLSKSLLPLDDLFAAQSVDVADYQDSLINEGVRQGVNYWVPFARSTPLFYYNKDMWAEAGLPDRGPETWAEFGEWAPKLVKKEGGEIKVAAFGHPSGASYIAWLFQGVVWQFGGKYSDPDFTMHMTNPETVRAGQLYFDSVHSTGWARPGKDHSSDFVNGLSAAGMMSTGSMGGIKANARFPFGTAFLPKEKNFGCCTGGAGFSVIKAAPADRQAALHQYITFASNTESTTFWAKSTGYMPVRKSAVESAEMKAYFAEFPQFRTAVDQLPLTAPQDSARVFVPNGDQIIGKGLERITVEKNDVAAAFAEVQSILEKDAEPVKAAVKAVEG